MLMSSSVDGRPRADNVVELTERDHNMKKIIAILLCAALAAPTIALARGGHYAGGRGSSHKGGKYKNARSRDHYQRRQ